MSIDDTTMGGELDLVMCEVDSAGVEFSLGACSSAVVEIVLFVFSLVKV